MIDMEQVGHTDRARITLNFDSNTEREQIFVVLEALAIFSKKNALYNDGWRKYGAYGGAFFVKDRAERIWEAMKAGTFNEEDALDLINLSAFTIRSHREGNYGGEYWSADDAPATDMDRNALQQNSLIRTALLDTNKGATEIIDIITAILS